MSDMQDAGRATKAAWIERVLGVRMAVAGPGGQAGTGVVAYAKSRLAWLETRRRVASDIERLTDALADLYDDEGFGDTIEALFRDRVSPIMSALDESLADKLDEATNETDPARRSGLVAEARGIVTRYQAYLASEPLIAKLDGNPLMPLSIARTMAASLQAVSTAIRP